MKNWSDEKILSTLRSYTHVPKDFVARGIDLSQSATLTFVSESKAAALIYDKIWVPPVSMQRDLLFDYGDDQPPDSVQFCEEDDVEIFNNVRLQNLFKNDETDTRTDDEIYVKNLAKSIDKLADKYSEKCRFSKSLDCGNSLKKFESEHPSAAYRAVMKNIPLIRSSPLTWKQVVELRSDKDSQKKLHWMKLWLAECFKGVTEHEAQDLLEQRLYDYKEALKKHGALTRNGTMALIFAGFAGAAYEPDENGLIFAFALGGNIAFQLRQNKIDRHFAMRQPGIREIAWLHDVGQESFAQKIKSWISRK